jgi:hypothetical protein
MVGLLGVGFLKCGESFGARDRDDVCVVHCCSTFPR